MTEKYKGRYTDMDVCPENPISWKFYPKTKNGKVGYADALMELFDQGMDGCLYVQIIKVPGEFPIYAQNTMELMEPEDACRVLANWCRYILYDSRGNRLV